jgi:recombination endonuclease VII
MKTRLCDGCGAPHPAGTAARPRKYCTRGCGVRHRYSVARGGGPPFTRAQRSARCRAANPGAQTAWKRKHRLKLKGLTVTAFDDMLSLQDGKCALCEHAHVPGDMRRSLVVDHCHTSGRIRGLLCHSCNRAIGLMRDDAARLRFAADYLEIFR